MLDPTESRFARNRRALGLGGMLSLVLVLGFGLSSGGVEVADLKTQLNSELRARRPVEFEFIARVVDLVEQEVLPMDLVQSSFMWARRKNPHRFQYFRHCLIIRARRLGIEIEPETPPGLPPVPTLTPRP